MTYLSELDPGQVIKASYPGTLYSGVKASIGGTALQITATSTGLANGVWIKALTGNSNTVYVGTTGVTTSTGYPLAATDSVFVSINDLSAIWVIGGASGQEIRYIGS